MKVERCPTCHRRIRRSSEQNSRYWALLHQIASHVKPEGVSYSADIFHLYFKSKFIGCDETMLPSGKLLVMPRSSAELDTDQFSDYMTKVEAWAADRDIFLADRETV